MAEIVIRPTMKFIKAGYVLTLLIIVAAAVAAYAFEWAPIVAYLSPVLLIWPLRRHLRNRMTRLTILDDKLRFDTGFLAKTTRTILLSRIQDLTVQQRVKQRIFGVGDLSIETAGETSSLTIPDIDRPQETADRIHDLARTAVGQTLTARNASPDRDDSAQV
jgi:uncharacterized membrane protein YdbT with pleckstrin-like domain